MDEVSYLKFSQHADLRALLFRTYPAVFFVQLPVTDPFWRDGAGIGMTDSELGRSLMRVREQLCVDIPIVVKKRSYPLPTNTLTNTRSLYGSSFSFFR